MFRAPRSRLLGAARRTAAFHAAQVRGATESHAIITACTAGPAAAASRHEPRSPVLKFSGLSYVDGPGVVQRGFQKQRLDVYAPPGGARDLENCGRPVVIHFHGGSWQRGDRSVSFYGSPAVGAGLASRGIVTVTPSYRLRSHGAIREDAVAAVEWVVANIQKYGGDPTRVYVSGHSAGGHISALLATNNDWLDPELRARHLAGAISISGVYNLMEPCGDGGGGEGDRVWLGGQLGGLLEAGVKNAFFRHMVKSRWPVFAAPGGGADVATLLNNSPAALVERLPSVPRGSRGAPEENDMVTTAWGWLGTVFGSARPLPPAGFTSAELAAATANDARFDSAVQLMELQTRPLLLLNAGADYGLTGGAVKFAALLRRLGAPVDHRVVRGTNHGSVCSSDTTLDVIAAFAKTPPAPAANAGAAAHLAAVECAAAAGAVSCDATLCAP